MTGVWWLVIFLASGLIYSLVLLSFERRKSNEPMAGEERYYSGLRALLRGDQEIAFERFKQAVMIDSQNVDAYLRIGDLLRERGQHQKAYSIHHDLSERGGLAPEENLAIRRALAEDQLALGNSEEAMRLLLALAEETDTRSWALRRLHRMHLQREDFEDAYKVRQELGRQGEPLESRIAALYLTMAGIQTSNQGDHRKGRVLLRDAIKMYKACHAAHYFLGVLYERDDRSEDAVRAWKTFLEHAPELAGILFPRLEKVLFDMGQYSEMPGVYQQVLTADPVNTDALLGLANFSEKKGDDQGAIEHLTRVLEIDPGHLLARQKLVHIYRQAGKSDEAWREAEGFFTWLPTPIRTFTCKQCNAGSDEPQWYCSRCRSFDSFGLSTRRSAVEAAAETS